MICPACQSTSPPGTRYCPTCGKSLAASATPATAPLKAEPTSALPAPTDQLTGPGALAPASRQRRRWGPFVAGWLAGAISAPGLLWLALLLLGGTNSARQGTPAAPGAPDIQVRISPSYMERSLAGKEGFSNPRITLGAHPQGGASLILTVGIDVPVLGVQDVQARSQVTAVNGRLIVVTEQAGLGENGGLPLPGRLVEEKISELVNEEIDKRIKSNPTIEVEIIGVDATADALHVDARLKPKKR